MKRTDLPVALRGLLLNISYVTIASVCPDGRPWNTPVYGVFDDELTLYWASWPGNQHSRNIEYGPDIFVALYDSSAPEGEAVGLYLQMKAKKLTRRSEIQQARTVYTTNFGEDDTHYAFTGACPRRLYKATASRVWYNSDDYIKGNFIDVRREITTQRV